MAKKSLTEAKQKKKGQAKTVLQHPNGKSGVKKKGPVTQNRSRAKTSSVSVSPLVQQILNKWPCRGVGEADPWGDEWKPPPKNTPPGAVLAIADLHFDISMVGKVDKALAYSLKLDLEPLMGPWFPWKKKGKR